MERHAKSKRFLALMLAFLMTLSSFTITPLTVFGDDTDAGQYVVDTVSPPAIVIPPTYTPDTTTPPAIIIEDCEFCDGFGCEECFVCEFCEGEGCELCIAEIDAQFLGVPTAPRFSHPGGVHASSFQLSIYGFGAEVVRYTTDGSEPKSCGPIVNGRSTYGPNHIFPHLTTQQPLPHIHQAYNGCLRLLQVVAVHLYSPMVTPSPLTTVTVRDNPQQMLTAQCLPTV